MIEVNEIGQYELQKSLEELYKNRKINFSKEHMTMYNHLLKYAGPNPIEPKSDTNKFLVAMNEGFNVVGIGLASFHDEESPTANLEILLSVDEGKGVGEAIVEGIIDYSRQMENRADLSLIVENDDLKSYYAKFKFVQAQRIPEGMVRQKSGEFDPYAAITKFKALPSTNQDINNKRIKAASSMRF